ncbi:MAG TPA: TonB-dependent receptor [Gemmatimonadales bacterium]|nr:TonB-dependent receptor [Gemmatimonadales bacterium]
MLDRLVTLDQRDVPLGDVLKAINQQAQLGLAYSAKLVPINRRVTIKADKITAGAALERVLQGTGMRAVEAPGGTVLLVKERRKVEASAAEAGAGTIGGWVRDTASHQPLKGAQVLVDNTSLSAFTNDSGAYWIHGVPTGPQTIRVRLIGYTPVAQTVTVPDSDGVRVDFGMSARPTRLADVVTTATGQRRRLELGNDITVLDADSIVATQPVSTITDLLATRVPGLTVLHTSGAPGDPARLRLRGASSITQTNDPVIIVDGVRVYYAQSDPKRAGNLAPGSLGQSTASGPSAAAPSPLDQIDPRSVATIEVFKGPSAATMYGPDAANGVIVITTKKGRAGPPRWTANVERGLTQLPGRYPEGYYAWGHSAGMPSNLVALCQLNNFVTCTADSLVRFQALNDPTTTVLGQGHRTAASVGVSGGVSALTYAVNANVTDEVGLAKLPDVAADQFASLHGFAAPDWTLRPQALTNWGVTSRLGVQLGAKADLSLSSMLTHQRQQRSTLDQQLGVLMGTYVDPVTGNYYATSGFGTTPSAQLLSDFYTRAIDEATNFTNVLSGTWRPRPWLTASADAGLNLISRQDEALKPRGFSVSSDSVGSVGLGHGTSLVKTVNLRLAVRGSLPLGFRFETSAGANYTNTSTADLTAFGADIPPGTSSFTGAAGERAMSEYRTDQTSFGWYVEPALHNGRLYLSTGLRLDGGNTYGSHISLATFPKVSASYLLSDEPWFPDALKFAFGTLRLRAAYGHAGVEPGIGDALRLFQQSRWWLDGQFTDNLLISTLGNTQLKPERSTEVEGGIDADVLGDRVTLSITGYRKLRYDALMPVPLAPSVYGGATVMRNIGTIRNTGLELSLGADLVRTNPLVWRTTLNLSRNHNRVETLNGGAPLVIGPNQRVVEGYPLFGFWARPVLGYADVNQDGILEVNEVQLGDSAVYLGSSEPNFVASITSSLRLFRGALTIDATLDHQNGFTQYNTLSVSNRIISRGWNDPSAPLADQAAAWATLLTPATALQAVTTTRLNSLSIGYQLPARWARGLGASALSVALQGTNLALWTNYAGKDPDVNADATGNTVADTGILPMPRTWQVRVSMAY